jgi:hypothetical protein
MSSPQGVAVSIETCSRVHLSWQLAGGNPGAFVIEKKAAPLNDFVEVATVDGTVLSYDDHDVALSKSYSYRVIAKRDADRSDPSNVVDVNISQPPAGSPQEAPRSLAITKTASGSARLTWGYAGPTGNNFIYRIYKDGVEIGTAPASQQSFVVRGIPLNREVKLRVAASNDICTLTSPDICYVDATRAGLYCGIAVID